MSRGRTGEPTAAAASSAASPMRTAPAARMDSSRASKPGVALSATGASSPRSPRSAARTNTIGAARSTSDTSIGLPTLGVSTSRGRPVGNSAPVTGPDGSRYSVSTASPVVGIPASRASSRQSPSRQSPFCQSRRVGGAGTRASMRCPTLRLNIRTRPGRASPASRPSSRAYTAAAAVRFPQLPA
nr:hypothetical protein [Frankia sp. ArI3]